MFAFPGHVRNSGMRGTVGGFAVGVPLGFGACQQVPLGFGACQLEPAGNPAARRALLEYARPVPLEPPSSSGYSKDVLDELRRAGRTSTIMAAAAIVIAVASLIVALVR